MLLQAVAREPAALCENTGHRARHGAEEMALISYRVRLADLDRHHFEVECRIDRPAAEQRFSLPAWIPGSYLLREFARHIVHIDATSGGAPVAVEKVASSVWVVRGARSELTLTATIYALDQSVRGAWLDRRRAFRALFCRAHSASSSSSSCC